MSFAEREIVHRRRYRPTVQGHVISTTTDGRVTVAWDINRPKHHAYLSFNLAPDTLVSDGFYTEPPYLAAIETPDLDPRARETLVRDVMGASLGLLNALTDFGRREPKDTYSANLRALCAFRLARLQHLKENPS